MKGLRLLALVVILKLCTSATTGAADIKIIANPNVNASEISSAELREVFLAKTRFLNDGTHVEPVLGPESIVREAFLKQYIGKTDAVLSTYYRSLVFAGRGLMPKYLPSDADVAAYVAKTKGAIGYLSATSSAAGTKRLVVK